MQQAVLTGMHGRIGTGTHSELCKLRVLNRIKKDENKGDKKTKKVRKKKRIYKKKTLSD